jgi:hypothetical protein
MILDLIGGTTEYTASDREVTGMIIKLNGSVCDLDAREIRWQ